MESSPTANANPVVTRRGYPWARWIVGVVAALALVGAYGGLMVHNGYVWPAPRVMPSHISIQGYQYVRADDEGCKPLTYWKHEFRNTLHQFRPIGSISSALYFGDSELYTQARQSKPYPVYAQVFAQNGHCLVRYDAVDRL